MVVCCTVEWWRGGGVVFCTSKAMVLLVETAEEAAGQDGWVGRGRGPVGKKREEEKEGCNPGPCCCPRHCGDMQWREAPPLRIEAHVPTVTRACLMLPGKRLHSRPKESWGAWRRGMRMHWRAAACIVGGVGRAGEVQCSTVVGNSFECRQAVTSGIEGWVCPCLLVPCIVLDSCATVLQRK